MSESARFNLAFGLLTTVLFYEVAQHGGGRAVDLSLCSIVLGLATILLAKYWSHESSRHRNFVLLALLFPAYLALQLIPLPLGLVRIISPARTEIADSLSSVLGPQHFASLSVAPSATWAYIPRIIIYVLAFLLLARLARHFRNRIWIPIIPLIVIGAIEAAIGCCQYFQSSAVVSGSYLSKDHFAGLMEMVLPFAAIGTIMLLTRDARERMSPAIAIKAFGAALIGIALLASILFSVSKMAFFSTLASLFVTGALWLGSRLSGWKKWVTLTGLGVTLLVVFALIAPIPLITGYGDLSRDPTAETRLPIWNNTLHLAADYPLFGCGGGNYVSSFLRYQTAGLHYTWSEAHNDYLQSLAELGICGFLIPAALIFLVFAWAARLISLSKERQVRFAALACAGSLAAILIHSFADFNLDVPANAMVMSWVSGIAAGLPLSRSRKEQLPGARTLRLPLAILVLGCFAVLQGSAWLLFLQVFNADPAAEQVFCRIGICDTESMLTIQRLLHGATLDRVPRSELQKFLSREPASPSRWSDLAESRERAGRTPQARQYFSRAIALGPNIPYTLFRAANFHFRLGENIDGLRLMAHALNSDPDYAHDVLTRYGEYHIPTEEILRYGLPDHSVYQEFHHVLMEENRTSDLEKAWEWGVSRGYADAPAANEYIEFLIHQGRPEAAMKAWALYAGKHGMGYADENRVFNGDFESDPLGSRFDWTIASTDGNTASLDPDVKHSGARCLRVQFDGTQNVGAMGIWQSVYLKPGHYVFRAYMCTKDLSTDQGVAFYIVDDDSPAKLNLRTDALRESQNWTLIEKAFDVPAGVRLVRVGLVRTPSLRFDCKIKGTVWVDQVSITPENDCCRSLR